VAQTNNVSQEVLQWLLDHMLSMAIVKLTAPLTVAHLILYT